MVEACIRMGALSGEATTIFASVLNRINSYREDLLPMKNILSFMRWTSLWRQSSSRKANEKSWKLTSGAPDKEVTWINQRSFFLISQPKHTFWPLIRTTLPTEVLENGCIEESKHMFYRNKKNYPCYPFLSEHCYLLTKWQKKHGSEPIHLRRWKGTLQKCLTHTQFIALNDWYIWQKNTSKWNSIVGAKLNCMQYYKENETLLLYTYCLTYLRGHSHR